MTVVMGEQCKRHSRYVDPYDINCCSGDENIASCCLEERASKSAINSKPTAMVCPLPYESSLNSEVANERFVTARHIYENRMESSETDYLEDYLELSDEAQTASNDKKMDFGDGAVAQILNFKHCDQPWDLSFSHYNLEESLQQLMRDQSAHESKELLNVLSDVARDSVNAELNDLRTEEGYDRPWDLRPHKKDDRGQEGYDKPWDLKPHNKDERPSEEYDVPWDKNARRIERELRVAQRKSIIKRKEVINNKLLPDNHEAAASQKSAKQPVKSPINRMSTSMVSAPTRSNDTRSNDEYDEPWDQKIQQIITKAVQSKNRVPVVAAPRKSKRASTRSNDFDIKAPLESQNWYHGMISRTQAEDTLRTFKEGSYLVRTSESNHQDYSLSVKSARGFMHMKITSGQDGRFILGQFSQPFQSIPQMIHHYTVNKLPIKGAEHISLLHPIPHEVL